MAGSRPTRVFISYARRDGATLAERLRADLSKKGLVVWQDIHGIPGGSEWTAKIVEALDNADVVLAILTPGYQESPNCRAEEDGASKRKKRIIPLLAVAGTPIPFLLGPIQNLDFSDASKYSERLADLLASLVPTIEELRKQYAQKLLDTEFRLVNLLGFPELKDRPLIELPRVFVMPSVSGADIPDRPAPGKEKKPPPMAGEEFDKGRNIAFVGKPGSGKTTLLRYIGRSCLEALPDVSSTKGLTPMFFWVRHMERASVMIRQPDDLWNYFCQYCKDKLDLPLPPGFFETQAEKGKLLVMIDGLDEVSSNTGRETLASEIGRAHV